MLNDFLADCESGARLLPAGYFPRRNDLLVPAVIQVFYVVVKLRKFPITCVADSDRINGTERWIREEIGSTPVGHSLIFVPVDVIICFGHCGMFVVVVVVMVVVVVCVCVECSSWWWWWWWRWWWWWWCVCVCVCICACAHVCVAI